MRALAVTERDAVDLMISAIICGAESTVAIDFMVGFMRDEGLLGSRRPDWGRSGHALRPYKPRHDPAGWTPRLPLNEWLRLSGRILRRDGHICTYCKDEDGPFEIDHIVPVTRGGSNEPDNLCVACKPCNSSKGDRLLSEWRGRYR